ncbi:MAG: fibrobacter succinogenes major paralogous domain-containing protein [Bacteroidia bacterium]|nr:fibrobacter succinogenes major paralogous domain-containing protein [Bacteroidia bacterium]
MMKNIYRISGVILVILSIFLIYSCKKKEKLMPPALITTAVNEISFTTATSGGDITDIGGAYVTARGVCWNTSVEPTIDNNKTTESGGLGAFTSSLTQLAPGTKYYVRAYGTNVAGTGYGNEIMFTTQSSPIIFNPNLTYGTVTDIDGNVYKTIIIGTQTWMAENLRTTKYKEGTAIPLLTDNTAWANLITPSYCWYSNNATTYKNTYGALYNWYSVNTGNLCPTGWHVPSYDEWTTLTTYLGDAIVAGGKLKETDTIHWTTPNTGATNESGFTALPGGNRSYDGSFSYIGYYGYWWSSTEYALTSDAYYRYISFKSSSMSKGNYHRRSGFSIRCLKD